MPPDYPYTAAVNRPRFNPFTMNPWIRFCLTGCRRCLKSVLSCCLFNIRQKYRYGRIWSGSSEGGIPSTWCCTTKDRM